MKRVCFCLFLSCLLLRMPMQVHGAYLPEVDYMERMIAAAVAGDMTAGLQAQWSRDEKISAMGLYWAKVDFQDLFWLSRLISTEAGSEWLGLFWKMAVGEVALNRVASPEFPNTVQGVATQPGQYFVSMSRCPDLASVQAAKRLLEGERVLFCPSVVFQANTPQGSGVYMELRDARLGTTYLCYSGNPELYYMK